MIALHVEETTKTCVLSLIKEKKPYKSHFKKKATSHSLVIMNRRQLSQELECPVCLQLPRNPPIFQCENGHLICCDCHPKLNSKCPQVSLFIVIGII